MAAYGHILAVNDMEAGAHRLIVGDTFGITALDDANNRVGKRHRELLDYFIVADYVDHSRRSDKSDAVECRFREKDISYLDDALLAKFFYVKIFSYGDRANEIIYAENLYSLEKSGRRYMVNHSAVTQGGYSEFLF